ncbi:MAG: hypothetical protein WA705_29025 [Candidatus Ozemobacteraceae bacterium]
MRLMITICLLLLLPICLLAGASDTVRFTRASDCIITDSSTNLQWLEGPDNETNWNEAQVWINSLGHGWRKPTRSELRGICIANSTRICGSYMKSVASTPFRQKT